MLRAFFHVGLAAVLVIAPALCCCTVRLIAAQLVPPQKPVASKPEASVPPCCEKSHRPAPRSCCTTQGTPAAPPASPERCDVCFAKTDAVLPEAAPSLAEPNGERVPVALLVVGSLPSKHLGLLGGLDPPERAGVDTRSDSLFMRHVLRS